MAKIKINLMIIWINGSHFEHKLGGMRVQRDLVENDSLTKRRL
jgi:hypothetical protein